ncbi:MAG: IS200/IS605 family transposase [Candidatus Handelsmanbacteria bacterium]|nr:IS200/IS605 family transposase [Candidatus Handelsmanbacteria bacterium]
MVVGRSSHAVFDTQYRLVWAPKYRKWILRGDALEAVRELFYRVVEDFDFVIEELEVAKNHVHIPWSFPPRYSISQVIGLRKSIWASRVFQEHPEVKRELWGGEFWADGYFACTVGDQVTAEVINRYVRYHRQQEKRPQQLDLFGSVSVLEIAGAKPCIGRNAPAFGRG